MTSNRHSILAVALSLTMLPAALDAQPKGTPVPPTLARAKLSEATAAAKQWKPDAILIQIAASRVGTNGMQVVWDYGFYSASARRCAVINIDAPGMPPFTQESGGPECASAPLPATLIDSAQAVTVARANGITAPMSNMIVMVEGPRTVWTVMDNGGTWPGEVIVSTDAVSGTFIDKIQQR